MRVADFSLEDLCVPHGLTEVIVRKIRQASRLFICTRCLRNAFVIRTGTCESINLPCDGRRTICFLTDLLLHKAFST